MESVSANRNGDLYQKLSPNKIRLLHLLPSTDSSSSIQCTLSTDNDIMDLWSQRETSDQEGSFEALSYTWGDESTLGSIVLNKKKFPVTHNLESFLRHRRQPQKTVNLWVDAICLNQGDIAEKNEQIPKMNMVYLMAPRLTVWLGDRADDSDLAMELVDNLASRRPSANMEHLSSRELHALDALLQRPWWTRTWIVQEVTLGGAEVFPERTEIEMPGLQGRNAGVYRLVVRNIDTVRNLGVMCGTKELPWAKFVGAAARIKHYEIENRQHFPNVETILALDSLITQVPDFMSKSANALKTENELDLVCRYRHFQAGNARDKLYAIQNIFSLNSTVKRNARYDHSIKDVYLEFASENLVRDYCVDLELLRHCGPSLHGLPSWVPDWSVPLNHSPLPLRNTSTYFGVPWWTKPPSDTPDESGPELREGDPSLRESEDMNQSHVWGKLSREVALPRAPFCSTPVRTKGQDNSGIMPVEAKIDIKRESLTVNAVFFDNVDTVGEPFVSDVNTALENATLFMVTVGKCKQLALEHSAAAKTYPDHTALLAAFWTTLFGGQVSRPGVFVDQISSPNFDQYADWLPEVPNSWTAAAPPLTPTTTGLLSLMEMQRSTESFIKARFPDSEMQARLGFVDMAPAEWSIEQRVSFAREFQQLADLWGQQPFDLYHRPFGFLHVIPDPYWRTRQEHDELAQRKKQQEPVKHLFTPAKLGDEVPEELERFMVNLKKQWTEDQQSHVSIDPPGTMDAGMEKYALGRRFFVSRKGYFGLGPKETSNNDRVAIVFGSPVPFILRKRKQDDSRGGWQLIGEAYMDGVMEGQIFKKWQNGTLEFTPIVLT